MGSDNQGDSRVSLSGGIETFIFRGIGSAAIANRIKTMLPEIRINQ